jgi:hypothetical protein
LCSARVLIQEDAKFVDVVLQGVKKAFFFTSNAIILQSMWSTFLKLYPHIILIVWSKILWLNLELKINKNQFIQFALEVAVLKCYFLNNSEGILGVNIECIGIKCMSSETIFFNEFWNATCAAHNLP